MTITTYQPTLTPYPLGLNVPYDQGYDARSRQNAPKAEDNGASGYLRRPIPGTADFSQIDLWITEVTADFSLSGEQGQSRMLREFFPRSFNDVTLQITGNVASTQEYNRLALFVREHHWSALHAINSGQAADQTIVFALNGSSAGSKAAQRPSDVVPSGSSPGGPQSNVKGPHRPWQVSGYVKTIAAGAVRWEVAPEFTLGFIVTQSLLNANTGIWSDTPDNGGNVLKSMLQLLGIANGGDTKTQGSGFVQDPFPPPPSAAVKKSAAAAVGHYLSGNWTGQAAATLLTGIF